MAVTARRPATYEDLVAAPEHKVAEILDGELITSPRPAAAHAYTAGMAFRDISTRFHGPPEDEGGGWWILFEPELHLGKDVVVPDVTG
jgi:hypothetical protein